MKNEIVCPNCGKINPLTAEFCSDCLTRFPKESQEPAETPEWLKKVRDRSQAEKPSTPPLGEFGEAEERPFGENIESAGEIPDWLKQIQPGESPVHEKDEVPSTDWITRLHELLPPSEEKPTGQSTTLYSEEELASMAAAARRINALTQDPPEQSPTQPMGVPREEPPSDFLYQPSPMQQESSARTFVSSEVPQNIGSRAGEPPILENVATPVESNLPTPEIPVSPIEGQPNEFVPWMREPATPQPAVPAPDAVPTPAATEANPPAAKPGKKKKPAVDAELKPESETSGAENTSPSLESLFGQDATEGNEPRQEEKPEKLIPESIMQPRYDRPVELSGRLEISDTQKASIDLLKTMLAGEMQPSGPVKTGSRFSGRILRPIIGVLLITVMLIPLITGYLLTGQQVLFSPGVVAMHNTVKSLPDNGSFLVINDYEPAFAGEMKAASAGVIDSLMMKGMNFSILSTVPTGPALARDLISSIRPANFGYQQEKIAYLGYLPGGSTGMLDFIHNPRSAMPLLDTGRYGWTYPATQSVNTIQDYAGILIVTENSEVGRAWLEQLYPSVSDKPVMMVVSAQSAPLMRPYLDSSQLKGLIGGRVEGAMYDRIMESPARFPAVNASYQAGMLLAAALIALGGLFGILQSVINRRPPAPMEDRHVG
jgi:hypothetical protein